MKFFYNIMDMIKQEGSNFVLYTKDGKRKLGIFSTRKDAEERERQILYFLSLSKKKAKG